MQLVNCVDAVHANLAVTALRAGFGCPRGRRAAVDGSFGGELRPAPARDVSVLLEEDGVTRPAVVIQRIPAGQGRHAAISGRVRHGRQHQVTAHCSPTPSRPTTCATPWSTWPPPCRCWSIDGDPRAQDAFFLSSALSPGGKVKSGLSPLVESPRFLRDHALDKYEAIFLLNVERLDAAEIEPLEAYVRAGGGLAFFLGELSQADFINKHLYRDGQGLFPLPLVGPTELLVDRLEKAPDLEVSDHPIFSVFAGERNSFIGTVVVERYFAAQKNWTPPPIRPRKSSPGCATALRWPSSAASAKDASSLF